MVRVKPRAALLLLFLIAAPAASATEVTLLDFSLATCAPCRRMDPVVARLESEGVRVQRIDGQRQPGLAAQHRVDRYPTFVVLVDGAPISRITGETPYETLRQMVTDAAPARNVDPRVRTASATSTPRTFAPLAASQAGPMLQAAAGRTPAIDVPGQPQSAQPAPSANPDALLNATVRLTVKDPAGQSYGTGTIVDARQGEALVLTCAHLFRSDDNQQISNPDAVTVELYQANQGTASVAERATVQRILCCNFDSDVALLSVRPTGTVAPARIAANADALRQGEPVFSSGCDHGADPTVRTGAVTAINRYQGSPNVTASGAPVVGRSGGGLFNSRGEVVGVCNAADYQDDEGIYSALAAVHAELDTLRLSAIYRGGPLSVASVEPAAAPQGGISDLNQTMTPLSRPIMRGQSKDPLDTLSALSDRDLNALQEIIDRAADSEVVCIVRPKSGDGRSEVLTLEKVSPEFVRALLAAYHNQATTTARGM